MSQLDPRDLALRHLLRDARAEPAPQLDWARIEERLLHQTRGARPSRRRSRQPYAWGALALAAAAVLWLVGTRSLPVTPPPQDTSTQASGPLRLRGDLAEVGQRFEAVREVTVVHPDRAEWTLAPGSSAILASKGELILVQLERGSVLSQVVPNPKPETFVVEAAGTRVAVHGTVFRVALEGGRVLVDVREGTVGVGPLGQAPAFLLRAPAYGNFAADGRSGNIDGRWVGGSASRPAGPPRPVPARSASAAAASSSPSASPLASASAGSQPGAAAVVLPAEPSINDIESGVARIVDATSDCFTRHTQSADGVQIMVHTALSLKVLESGAVTDVNFQPPLSPDVEACAAASIAQIPFASSKQGTQVTRMLELKK